MITSFEVYLAILIGSLSPIFALIAGIALFISGILICASLDDDKDEETQEQAKKLIKYPASVCILFCLLALLTPSKKEIAAIYLIPKIANNELTQKLPSYIEPFLNKLLNIEDSTSK